MFSQLMKKFSCLIFIEIDINDHLIYFIGAEKFIAKHSWERLQFDLGGFIRCLVGGFCEIEHLICQKYLHGGLFTVSKNIFLAHKNWIWEMSKLILFREAFLWSLRIYYGLQSCQTCSLWCWYLGLGFLRPAKIYNLELFGPGFV
jgi:hypothetical protein